MVLLVKCSNNNLSNAFVKYIYPIVEKSKQTYYKIANLGRFYKNLYNFKK